MGIRPCWQGNLGVVLHSMDWTVVVLVDILVVVVGDTPVVVGVGSLVG